MDWELFFGDDQIFQWLEVTLRDWVVQSWTLLVLMSLSFGWGALFVLRSVGLVHCGCLVEGNGCMDEGKSLCD